jgi:predicted oxidoreductase
VYSGCLGTKGGPRTDTDAQVLDVDGAPIEGLYAAGNVMAGITGPGYPGAGATIGAALTFGYAAGRHAATRS